MRPVVHIIEWLPVIDYLNEEREAPALSAALRLHDVFHTLHSTFTEAAFLAAFQDVAAWHNAMDDIELEGDEGDDDEDDDDDEVVPIIHISAHGNSAGVGVDDRDEEVAWPALGSKLSDLSDEIGGVVLAMASCRGFHAYKAAGRSILPFTHIVGSKGEPDPAEILAGFSTLYYQLNRDADWGDAVSAMKIASGHMQFVGLEHDEAAALYERRRQRIARIRQGRLR